MLKYQCPYFFLIHSTSFCDDRNLQECRVKADMGIETTCRRCHKVTGPGTIHPEGFEMPDGGIHFFQKSGIRWAEV